MDAKCESPSADLEVDDAECGSRRLRGTEPGDRSTSRSINSGSCQTTGIQLCQRADFVCI
eukprot:1997556-Rhodomonas_salina.1